MPIRGRAVRDRIRSKCRPRARIRAITVHGRGGTVTVRGRLVGDVRLGQGRENVTIFLKENTDLFDEIKQKVLDKKGVIVWMPKKDPANTPEPAAADITADITADGDGGADESDG